jgi:hypothetical protein
MKKIIIILILLFITEFNLQSEDYFLSKPSKNTKKFNNFFFSKNGLNEAIVNTDMFVIDPIKYPNPKLLHPKKYSGVYFQRTGKNLIYSSDLINWNTAPVNDIPDNSQQSVQANSGITTVPSPVTDIIQIVVPKGVSVLNVQIITLQGTMLIQTNGISRIDVSSLQTGMYYIKVNSTMLKFIKI